MKEIAYGKNLQELDWEKAREYVIKVNPELAKVIDSIGPDKKHTVFKARYFYGDEILKKAKFFLPGPNGQLMPLENNAIDNHVKESLDYNLHSNPVMMLLNNALELFLPLEDRTIPINNLVYPGSIFGSYRILTQGKLSHQPIFIWDMTAGARSIFMLAKISDAEKHKKLRKMFALSADTPKTMMEHWRVFKEIANHKSFSKPWYVDTLCFSKQWFEHFNDDHWMSFNYYLYRSVWNGGDFWRNLFFWDIIFSLIQKNIHFRPSAYIADTVKYILAISIGESLGFLPATNDIAAPISELQKVYINIYNVKQTPIIMQPGTLLLDGKQSRPVYYSLRFPSAMELGGKSRSRDNFINDIFEIKSLLNQYIKNIVSGEFNLEGTPFYKYLRNVRYEYIHGNGNVNMTDIKTSEYVFAQDASFIKSSYCKKMSLPVNASFLKGCIKIIYDIL